MSKVSYVPWPELPTAAWRETYATLHLWTQIIGKVRLARAPWLNHSWQVALYVTARGLSTSPIPDGTRSFQLDLDFIDHALRISTSSGATMVGKMTMSDSPRIGNRSGKELDETREGASVFPEAPRMLINSVSGEVINAN